MKTTFWILVLSLFSVNAQADDPWTGAGSSSLLVVRATKAGSPSPEIGTGFFVSPDGMFLTAKHVVDGAVKVETSRGGSGGPWSSVNLAGILDLGWDIALLKNFSNSTPYPTLALDFREAEVGDVLWFGGYPFGAEFDHRSATVSTTFGVEGGWQTTGLAAGGFSGGPALDPDGIAIGIITSGMSKAPGFLQIVPLLRVRSRLNDLGIRVIRKPHWQSLPSTEITRQERGRHVSCDCLAIVDSKLTPVAPRTLSPRGSFIEIANQCRDPVAVYAMRDYEYQPQVPMWSPASKREFFWDRLEQDEHLRVSFGSTFWAQFGSAYCPQGHERADPSPVTPTPFPAPDLLPYPLPIGPR